MVKASGLYAGQYLTAAELPPGRHKAAIHNVDVEQVGIGNDTSQKLVLSVTSPAGKAWKKRIVLNKTNSLVLAAAYGDETDEWPGKRVEIWSEMVLFQGKRVPGLRVDAAGSDGAAAPAAKPKAAPATEWDPTTDVEDDEIPF